MERTINEYRIINEYGLVIYIYGATLSEALENYDNGLEFDEIVDRERNHR